MRAAEALGYAPDWRFRARARQRYNRIGLLYGSRVPIFFSLYEGFADALGDEFSRHGFDLIFIPAVAGIHDWERNARDLRLDGLIVTDPVPPHLDLILRSAGLPTVMVNHHAELPVARLVPDEADGIRQLIAHLTGLGHRRIYYYQSLHLSGHPSVIDRQQAYRQVMGQLGLQVEIITETLPEAVRRFSAERGPLAVIAYNCADGAGLAEGLTAAGVAIPQRLSLVCFDDIELTRKLGLTVVNIPRAGMGKRAARMLVDLIAGRTPLAQQTCEELYPVSLELRSSTAVPVLG